MIKVFNTMSRTKEIFKPLKTGEVSIYCCGVTPYSSPHIGNARPFVIWDVIRRFFAKSGYKVRYVQNFTDVDDKIIKAANKHGVTWKDIAEKNIAVYFKCMDALNVRRADIYPRVSETMDDIIRMIQTLVDKGFAYVLEGGDVFYSVEKIPHYGKLSRRTLDDMMAGARVAVDERKHHPMDFALWKSAKPDEPAWDSPWGKGRPGWHIECSAMSLKFLGEKFDFHGGGSDLIFPHHENEIAQSQAALGDENSFAQYWVHNGFITIGNEKASKSNEEQQSKKTLFTVEEILAKYPGEVVRLLLLQTHYRNPLEFSESRLVEAQEFFGKLARAYWQLDTLARKIHAGEFIKDTAEKNFAITVSRAGGLVEEGERLLSNFYAAMSDDFNTALAITYMFELAGEISDYYGEFTAGEILPVTIDGDIILRVRDIYLEMADILGIFEQPVPIEQAEEISDDQSELVNALMKIILDLRQDARSAKNWATADKIRDELKASGIVVEDTPQGAIWHKA